MSFKFVFSLIVLVAGASVASAAIVVNGSFEQPNYNGGWGLSATDGVVGGWYAEANVLEIGAGSIYGVTGYDQRQVLELDGTGNAKVSQNISGLVGSHAVSFIAALRKNVAASAQGGDLYWNDALVGSFLPASTAMQSYTFTVIGTGSDKLSFVGTGTSNSLGTLIDNVTMEAVPEPATMAGLVLGVLALVRRRKQA